MKVFVDTSAWFASYDRHDQSYAAAERVTRHLHLQHATLVLSDFVLTETLTLIRYRLGHVSAVRFGQAVLESRLAELVAVTEPIRQRAWEIFQRYDDKTFSFTDCSSFAVMESLELKTAFAFDTHFEQYGFHLLKA